MYLYCTKDHRDQRVDAETCLKKKCQHLSYHIQHGYTCGCPTPAADVRPKKKGEKHEE